MDSGAEELAACHRSAVGDRRPQSLSGGVAGDGQARRPISSGRIEQAFERCGVPESMLMDHGTPWWNCSRSRAHAPVAVDDAARHPALLVRYPPPADPGQGGALHGSLQRHSTGAEAVWSEPQRWLDAFRSEYNQLRPHEALG